MILVLHYDSDFRKCLVRLFQIWGFDAAGFAAGAEAMVAMRRQRPRLLILNGTLSDMEGIELLRMARADKALADLPVCFTSGNDDKKPEAQRLGVAEYLLKPLDVDALNRFVEKTLGVAGIKSSARQRRASPACAIPRK